MSDSVFLFSEPADEEWERARLSDDEMEFPAEIEAQLASLNVLDESYFLYSESKGNDNGGGSSKRDPNDVWEDLGLEDFVLGIQKEQRIALPPPPEPNPDSGSNTPNSATSQ